jgi:two-component system NtrC family response regulator
MVLLTKGSELTVDDLPDFLHPGVIEQDGTPGSAPAEGTSLEAVEKQMILKALRECAGNQTHAARKLGMSRRALAYRLEKYGVYGDKLKALKHGAS